MITCIFDPVIHASSFAFLNRFAFRLGNFSRSRRSFVTLAIFKRFFAELLELLPIIKRVDLRIARPSQRLIGWEGRMEMVRTSCAIKRQTRLQHPVPDGAQVQHPELAASRSGRHNNHIGMQLYGL